MSESMFPRNAWTWRSGLRVRLGRYPTDPDRISSLAGYLRELTPHLVVIEDTGSMELALAGELAAAQLSIAVVNLRHQRDFARASGKLAKTAALDAQVLAQFA